MKSYRNNNNNDDNNDNNNDNGDDNNDNYASIMHSGCNTDFMR